MIQAVFEKKNGRFCSVTIEGHAGYADAGEDVVCASVSSAVQLTSNLITDTFREKAKVTVQDDLISIRLKENRGNASAILNGLCDHLRYLSEDYPGTISIKILEV